MRVARQALATHLLAEIEQLLLAQAAFEVGAGIDTGRHVPLDVEAVTAVFFTRYGAFSVPEVVKAGAKHMGQRGKGADVAAQVPTVDRMMPVGLDHHGHGVPAHVGTQPLFDLDVARATLFLVGLDGVDVTGIG